ncbi:phosphoribosylglycinamide formyltransferase [Youngiibacter multivorans]|uniref:Phosphoribosylglycinamide formyltransferase n=1 Tax=Youngiibacter multivorans TaxID=937251 RepID=A0ABS4G730_9CLOT|nr:phosphoribosylglycinamide formyltransferase [Youngiibacter multivorans]MBP1920339.1 phosphoribosylglycinamide formyltransferase-1 [Youngiibacter multivorans]
MYRIAVLISGTGSNLLSLIEDSKATGLYEIAIVVADRDAKGINHASENSIPYLVLDRKDPLLSDKVLEAVKGTDLVVLAGFLSILKGQILKEYKDRIINIHPSLLPQFGGEGMYGLKVHEAVLKSGKLISGCTVHYVNEDVDAGRLILQSIVSTEGATTPEELQARVLGKEHDTLTTAVRMLAMEGSTRGIR